MAASKVTSGNKNALLYALVVFIVLFLAVTVVAIVTYLNTSEHVKAAEEAEERLAFIANDRDYNEIKAMATGRFTAIDQIRKDYKYFSRIIHGADAEEVSISGARKEAAQWVEPLWEQAQMVLAIPSEADASVGLVGLVGTLVGRVDSLQSVKALLEGDLKEQDQQNAQSISQMGEIVNDLQTQLDAANRIGQTQRDEYDQLYGKQTSDYEQIVTALKSDLEIAQANEKKAQNQVKQLKRDTSGFAVELKKLNDRLAMFQPRPETEAAILEPDGYIVRVVPRDNLAYINLAKGDHIYRGLTFAVYDSFQAIPKTGQGKGTLEVVEIMDNISKCRITRSDPTSPIMDNDIIANVVWDADKEYLFCVIGDFDISDNGQILADGRAHIVDLIKEWGGRVEELSVETDFLIVGQAPFFAGTADDEFEAEAVANDITAESRRQAAARSEAYKETLNMANALDVPTFNLSRFLQFIGRHE